MTYVEHRAAVVNDASLSGRINCTLLMFSRSYNRKNVASSGKSCAEQYWKGGQGGSRALEIENDSSRLAIMMQQD